MPRTAKAGTRAKTKKAAAKGRARRVRVALSLPAAVVRRLERVCKKRGRPRNELLSEAVGRWLAEAERKAKAEAADRAYREAYRRMPETEEELELGRLGLKLLGEQTAGECWE